MTLADHLFANAEENLKATYFAIASGLPGPQRVDGRGFSALTGSFQHPICNFAVCSDTADLDVQSLKRVAATRRFFNLYVCHYGADFTGVALGRERFDRLYTLVQMSAQGATYKSNMNLVEGSTDEERLSIAKFMAEQFFFSQTTTTRDQISQATADAANLELRASYAEGAGPIGAVMVNRTRGAIGLYNLCVDMRSRLRGYGADIVRYVLNLAYEQNEPVVLQCDPKLQPWYEGLGFQMIGTVDVYVAAG